MAKSRADGIAIGNVKEQWYNLTGRKGYLSVKVRPETASGKMNPSFVARRKQHTKFTAATSLLFNPAAENEKAGLLCFMNEDHFYFLCKSSENNDDVIQLYQSPRNIADSNTMILLASDVLTVNAKGNVQFRVQANADKYAFYYSTNNSDWKLIKDDVDGKFLSTKEAGGFAANFVGSTIALYATSLGTKSTNTARFDWFEYKGDDEVYRKNNK